MNDELVEYAAFTVFYARSFDDGTVGSDDGVVGAVVMESVGTPCFRGAPWSDYTFD